MNEGYLVTIARKRRRHDVQAFMRFEGFDNTGAGAAASTVNNAERLPDCPGHSSVVRDNLPFYLAELKSVALPVTR